MNAEVLPRDDIAARELMEAVWSFATLPQAEVIARVAQRFADHRTAFEAKPGPLAEKLDEAYHALLRAGYPDDELLKRLRTARDFARNLPGKERAA